MVLIGVALFALAIVLIARWVRRGSESLRITDQELDDAASARGDGPLDDADRARARRDLQEWQRESEGPLDWAEGPDE
jgi:hypothetical protein